MVDQIKEGMHILIDDKLFPVKKLITNQKYSFDKNKYRFNGNKMAKEKRLLTFLGKQMNPFDVGYDKTNKNFKEFKDSIRWFSYRENIKNLRNSKKRKFSSDASKILYY
jgi:hypothetical protein